MRVTRGPRENRFRPAVGPLFRTAAISQRARVIGIILSGSLDDGAVGLAYIKQYRGIAVVQSPDEAMMPSMPQAAIRHVKVDHVLPIDEIATTLVRLVNEPLNVPEEVVMADEISRDVAETGAQDVYQTEKLGAPVPCICPDCGGTLYEWRDGDLFQYTCHVGHRYSGDSLRSAQNDDLDHALWAALRALQESGALRQRMSDHARQRGMDTIADEYAQQARESDRRADTIRRVLMPDVEPGEEPVDIARAAAKGPK
jgi:two-component system chemotaxis response regulator CheB